MEIVSQQMASLWYEHSGIPLDMETSRCPGCRWNMGAMRRISDRLSGLPQLEDEASSITALRQMVLAIAEGLVRCQQASHERPFPTISSTSIIEKGAALITRARRISQLNDDLLPIQVLFQERLGYPKRAARLKDELAVAAKRTPATGRAIRHVSTWLATPDLSHRTRITDLEPS